MAISSIVLGLLCVPMLAVGEASAPPAPTPTTVVSREAATAWQQHKATVLFFLYTDCPIANGYAPEMARIAQAYGPKDVAFYRVYPAAGVNAAAAERHGKDFSLPFPAVLDAGLDLVKLTGARVTPTAAVFDQTGKRRYLGRIDDRYADLGKRRAYTTTNDLRDALDAVLAGKEVAVAETRAIGCYLPEPPADSAPKTEPESGAKK